MLLMENGPPDKEFGKSVMGGVVAGRRGIRSRLCLPGLVPVSI